MSWATEPGRSARPGPRWGRRTRPPIGTVTGSDGALAITWSAPGDHGGAAVTGYSLRYIRQRFERLRRLPVDLRKRHLDLRRPGVHPQRADQRRPVQAGPAGGQFRGLRRMVRRERSPHGHSGRPPGGARRADEYQGVFERNGGGHQLVRPGRRRWRRHHQP